MSQLIPVTMNFHLCEKGVVGDGQELIFTTEVTEMHRDRYKWNNELHRRCSDGYLYLRFRVQTEPL